MNWHFPLIFAALTSTCLSFQQDPMSVEELGSDIGIQVFNQLAKTKPKDNIVVSPHGIASLLGMLQLGADGKTAKELITVMKYNISAVGKVLKNINKNIASRRNKDIVTIANAVFAKNGLNMEESFVSRNKELFQCSVNNVSFEEQNAAADTINQWVKNNTNGMIDSVLSPDSVDSATTKLVLVNAIYFKGLWKSRFQPEKTKKQVFNGADGKIYQVPMMSQFSLFLSGTTSTPGDLWYNIIELPYHGENISMWIALPAEIITPLSDIIPHISTKTIQSWKENMIQKKLRFILPKFTAETETNLQEPLEELGIRDMFDESKANFAKITQTEHLYVSEILQKTKFEVSENGTKASAASAAALIARSSSPPWFVVDRPFAFFVYHNPTGAVLFMGQINKP